MRSRAHRLFEREKVTVLEVDFLEVVKLDVVEGHGGQLETEGTTESDLISHTIPRGLETHILDDNVTLVILGNTRIEIHDNLLFDSVH